MSKVTPLNTTRPVLKIDFGATKDQITKNIQNINEQFKKIIGGYPTVSFTIYIIFFIANAILIGYLLSLNSNSDPDIQHKVMTWGLFIAGIIMFIVNGMLFFIDFEGKQLILSILLLIQTSLSASSLIVAKNYGHIGPQYTDIYNIAQGFNILTSAIGLIPIYYS